MRSAAVRLRGPVRCGDPCRTMAACPELQPTLQPGDDIRRSQPAAVRTASSSRTRADVVVPCRGVQPRPSRCRSTWLCVPSSADRRQGVCCHCAAWRPWAPSSATSPTPHPPPWPTRRAHAFFQHRTTAQNLTIAVPWTSPWLPRGLRTRLLARAFRRVVLRVLRHVRHVRMTRCESRLQRPMTTTCRHMPVAGPRRRLAGPFRPRAAPLAPATRPGLYRPRLQLRRHRLDSASAVPGQRWRSMQECDA
jgi:hypothetical protein